MFADFCRRSFVTDYFFGGAQLVAGYRLGALLAEIVTGVDFGAGLRGLYCRLTRTVMVEEAPMHYVRTARAKGLSEMRVQLVHCFKNALPPVVAYWRLQFRD